MFRIDKSGKSKALYLKKNSALSIKDINLLFNIFKNKKQDIRICLHKNKKSKLHIMIICLNKKKKIVPQVHLTKDEFYYIIKGKLIIKIYSVKKKIVEKIILGKKNKFYFLNKKIIHSTASLSKQCIFLECRTGPFDPKETRYYY
jgi:cupin fold WbuC family metalloprotein